MQQPALKTGGQPKTVRSLIQEIRWFAYHFFFKQVWQICVTRPQAKGLPSKSSLILKPVAEESRMENAGWCIPAAVKELWFQKHRMVFGILGVKYALISEDTGKKNVHAFRVLFIISIPSRSCEYGGE